VIHDLKNVEMHPRAETLLYQAARAQIVEQVIRPRLEAGEVVISDRYADSTIAYQVTDTNRTWQRCGRLVRYATGGLVPDMTVLLDVDVELGLRRKTQDGNEWNRLDAYTIEFHRRVRGGYLEMAGAEPQRWTVIDAGQEWDAVQEHLRAAILTRLAPGSPRIDERRTGARGEIAAQRCTASDILNKSSTGLGDSLARSSEAWYCGRPSGAALGEEWNPSCTSAICRIRPRRTTCAPCSPRRAPYRRCPDQRPRQRSIEGFCLR